MGKVLRTAVAGLAALVLLGSDIPSASAAKGGGTNGACSRRKPCPIVDTTATTSTTVADTDTVTSSDATAPDATAPETETPTDTTTLTSSDDAVVTDPAAAYALWPIGRTRMAQWGDVSGVIYSEQVTNRKVVFFRNAATRETSTVDLPLDSLYGWSDVATVMTSATELWIMGGGGPLHARRYVLSGSSLPTSAVLASTTPFGDGDSRPGDLLRLDSGGLVAVWHQQAITTPESIHVAHLPAGGAWTVLPPLTNMGSRASKQVLAQHPADGGVWMFHNADAFGTIGAARFIEVDSVLSMSFSDPRFISGAKHGLNSSDPENPSLAVAVDAAASTIRVAYQSADRQRFYVGEESRVASRIAVAAIAASGSVSFTERAPVWAERVSPIGLVVTGDELVISYLPLDLAALTADVVEVLRHSAGAWGAPVTFGTKHPQTYRVTYAVGRPEFATKLADGKTYLRTI